MERKIARLNERITIQRNEVVTDKYGNHKNTWTDYFTCFAYASTYQYDKENEAAITTEEQTIYFEVRYCPELANLTSTNYRIVFHGDFYDMRSTVTTATGVIKNTVANAWTAVNSNTTTSWNSIKTTITSALTSIRSSVDTAMGVIKNTIANTWTAVVSNTTTSWETIRTTITTKLTEIKTAVTNALTEIKTTFSTTLTDIANTVKNKMAEANTNMTSALNTMKTNVSNACTAISNSCSSILGGISSSAYSWGADICIQMASGINNNAWRVTNAARSLANSVDNILGFSVPEEGPLSHADEYMPDFMELLAEGIKKSSKVLVASVREIASSVGAAFTGLAIPEINAGQLALAGGGAGGDVTNNRTINMGGLSVVVNGYEAQNDNDLADTIVHRINEMLNEDDSVWGK